MSEASAALHMQAYARAVFERDVGAMMQLYADDVRVFDAWGVWYYEGALAWRPMIEEWFSTLGQDRVEVIFNKVQVLTGGELTSVTAIVTYAHRPVADVPAHTMENRLSWLLKADAAGCSIVHEHTSLPVSFEDSKAILRVAAPGTD